MKNKKSIFKQIKCSKCKRNIKYEVLKWFDDYDEIYFKCKCGNTLHIKFDAKIEYAEIKYLDDYKVYDWLNYRGYKGSPEDFLGDDRLVSVLTRKNVKWNECHADI